MEHQQILVEQKVLTIPSSAKSLVEALIFAADKPLSIKQIKAIYDNQGIEGEPRSIEADEIQAIIAELNQEFHESDKAYRIIQIAGGYQFATLPEYAGWLGKLYREQSRRKLSQSSLETLAIIAYKQPINKPEIEAIRGVNCDYVLKTLLEKELVTVVGRAETVGRPLLYGTTKEFLKHFGLNDVTDLPRPREIEEILGESQFETERRMLEAQAGAEKVKQEEEDFTSRLPHIPKKKPELDELVQIIPRHRLGKIKVRKSKPAPVDDSQKPLQFEPPEKELTILSTEIVPEMVGEPVDSSEVRAAVESTNVPVDLGTDTVTAEVVGIKEEPSIIAPVANIPEALTVEEIHPIETPAAEIEPLSPTNSELATPIIPATEEEQGSTRPTRWQTWKEKIQTFIKKLFA